MRRGMTVADVTRERGGPICWRVKARGRLAGSWVKTRGERVRGVRGVFRKHGASLAGKARKAACV